LKIEKTFHLLLKQLFYAANKIYHYEIIEVRIRYTSPISQNAIINSCNSILLNKIVGRVNEAICFTVFVGETADIAGLEQVSICVRYIDLKCIKLHQEFLQFVPTTNASGKGLSNLILDNLRKFGKNTQYLWGQGYDSAATTAGKYNGVPAIHFF